MSALLPPNTTVLLVYPPHPARAVSVRSRKVLVRSLKAYLVDSGDTLCLTFTPMHDDEKETDDTVLERLAALETEEIGSFFGEHECITFLVQNVATTMAVQTPVKSTPTSAFAAILAILAANGFPHVPSAVPSRRSSSFGAGLVADSETCSLQYCDTFTFLNRETQCHKLLQAFAEMEELRGTKGHDSQKRKLTFPVCAGMPGIGKTRFARVAVAHAIKHAEEHGINKSSITRVAVAHAVKHAEELGIGQFSIARVDVANAEELRTEHLEGLVRSFGCLSEDKIAPFCNELLAAHDARNFRVAGDEMVSRGGISVESAAAIEIIMQALCQTPGMEADEYMRNRLAALFCNCSLDDAIECVTGGDKNKAVIINIDEAHCLVETLPQLLNALAKLITSGRRIYVIVTGVSPEAIKKGVDASAAGMNTIHLPLLEPAHIEHILQTLCGTSDPLPIPLKTVVWWLGGVPRYLEWFLECAAKKFLCHSHADLMNTIWTKSAAHLMDVVNMVCLKLQLQTHPAELFENVLAFAITETPLSRPTNLLPSTAAENYTASWAEAHGIVYLEPTSLGDWVVRVPPLVLHHVQQLYASSDTLARIPCLDAQVYMNPTDSKIFALSFLLMKFRAFSVLGMERVSLSKLSPALPAVTVAEPRNHTYNDILRTDISSEEDLWAKIKELRDTDRDCLFGIVNKRSASACDAYLILSTAVITIQERQHVTPCQEVVTGESVTRKDAISTIVEDAKETNCDRFKAIFMYTTVNSNDSVAVEEYVPFDAAKSVSVGGHKAIEVEYGQFVSAMRANNIHHLLQ